MATGQRETMAWHARGVRLNVPCRSQGQGERASGYAAAVRESCCKLQACKRASERGEAAPGIRAPAARP